MSYSIVVLGSGRGSNAEALLKAAEAKTLGSARVAALVSDQEIAGILDLGQKYSVPAIYLDPGRPKARLTSEAEDLYIERIKGFNPDLIVLAGFMRLLSDRFIQAFDRKIINLHPSLLPSFPGIDGIGQAFRYGVKITGCTVHWVTPEMDAGPIIDQRAVRIEDGESEEVFARKLHVAEHCLLPDVVARLSTGKLSPV